MEEVEDDAVDGLERESSPVVGLRSPIVGGLKRLELGLEIWWLLGAITAGGLILNGVVKSLCGGNSGGF